MKIDKRLLTFGMMSVLAWNRAFAVPPPLVNPLDQDSEYELDLFRNFFDPSWEGSWWSSPTGFRVTGGSLNIRHIDLFQEAKIRFDLIAEKLWFRFRHFKDQTINSNRQEDAVELEYSPHRLFYLSQLGSLAFHKKDIDLGWALRFGPEEGESLRFEYSLLDFDANYAFRDKSTDEGFEEYNLRQGRQLRLRAATSQTFLTLWAEAAWRYGFEKEFVDLATGARETRRADDYHVTVRTLWNKSWLTPALDVEADRQEFMEDFQAKEKRLLLRPYILTKMRPGTLLTGCGLVWTKGNLDYPGSASGAREFETTHVLPFVLFQRPLGRALLAEVGYLHDTIQAKKNTGGFYSVGRHRENMAKLALEIRFASRGLLKIVSGWELDKEDFGRFAYFDGAHAQFQVIF